MHAILNATSITGTWWISSTCLQTHVWNCLGAGRSKQTSRERWVWLCGPFITGALSLKGQTLWKWGGRLMRRGEPVSLGCAIGSQEAGRRNCPQQVSVLCTGGCSAASLTSAHWAPPPNLDLTIYAPWGAKSPPFENCRLHLFTFRFGIWNQILFNDLPLFASLDS